MPGNLVDLGQPGLVLPGRITIDSSLLVARWLAGVRPSLHHQAALAAAFFRRLRAGGTVGFVPSVALHETLHIALATEYRLVLPVHRAVLQEALPGKRRFDWDDLYKVRPDLIPQFRLALTGLWPFLAHYNLAVLQPTDLGPLAPGQLLEDALLDAVIRYQLDTNDAAILLETHRAGIAGIATLDADLRHAARDFDVYTWR